LPIEEDPLKEEKAAAKKKQLRLFILLGTVGTVVTFVGLAAVILITPEKMNIQKVVPSPIVINSETDQSVISKRLDELEADIHAADPIEVGFPYPPVNSGLFLDQPKRR
jgi:type IV secretory pathway component VirB8